MNRKKNGLKHLFSVGDVEGVSLKSTIAYIEHLTDQRMRAVGLDSPFTPIPNPYPWMNKWLKSDNVQVAARKRLK
ncbi:aerobic ribonucleotide reductase B subunit [Klebsiella phage CPRSA]|nr:aerobic ribonucleotide reductase B subunit [Klebsiella phage CPRSA]